MLYGRYNNYFFVLETTSNEPPKGWRDSSVLPKIFILERTFEKMEKINEWQETKGSILKINHIIMKH